LDQPEKPAMKRSPSLPFALIVALCAACSRTPAIPPLAPGPPMATGPAADAAAARLFRREPAVQVSAGFDGDGGVEPGLDPWNESVRKLLISGL
jgi:hypothetical protein